MRFIRLLILFLAIFAIPFAYVIYDRTLHKSEISIATGGKSGGYYATALKYKKILKNYGIDLKLITTNGSIDAQNRLINSKVDYAFVQGGTQIKDRGIKALANIAYEPIWVFVRDKNISKLNQLFKKRVAVGKIGSGVWPVAKNLLNELGIDENNTKLLHLSNSDAAKKLQEAKIDAMFYVASPNAKIVKELLLDDNISLLNFQDANTFRQYFLKKSQDFQILKLFESSFDLKEHSPKDDHTLLAKHTILATKSASDDMTRLMMKVVDEVHKGAGIFHKEGTFPNSSMLPFPQDDAAREYFSQKSHFYEEHFDYWTAQSLNRLHDFVLLYILPILTIFAFFVEVIMPTIEWIHRKKIIKWYDKINALDTGIEHLSVEEAKKKKAILEDILHEVRNQDDIPPSHMEEFYSLQNQIANILNDLQKQIDGE